MMSCPVKTEDCVSENKHPTVTIKQEVEDTLVKNEGDTALPFQVKTEKSESEEVEDILVKNGVTAHLQMKTEKSESEEEEDPFECVTVDCDIKKESEDDEMEDKAPPEIEQVFIREQDQNVEEEEPNKPQKKLPHVCEYCAHSFSRRGQLVYHVRSKHTFEKPFKCDLCELEFYTAPRLTQHKKQCHRSDDDSQLRKFPCAYCDKSYTRKRTLDDHMRVHTNERNFKCTLCDRAFFKKIHLQRHHLSHTNEKPFKCPLCFIEYKDQHTLNVHKRKVHNIGTAKIPVVLKRFPCHICGRKFDANCRLQEHIRTHMGVKPFQCAVCKACYARKRTMTQHVLKKHNTLKGGTETVALNSRA